MARVYVDPDRLEEFARRLAEFSREVNLIYSNLDGRLKSLNATWRDQEYEKFKDAFADLQKLLRDFTRMVDQTHPELRKLAWLWHR